MKIIIQILALVFLAGCASRQAPPLPAQIKQARQRFAEVSETMSRDDVHRLLGAPQQTEAGGVERWNVIDGRYGTGLAIAFSPTGKIVAIDDPGLFIIGQ